MFDTITPIPEEEKVKIRSIVEKHNVNPQAVLMLLEMSYMIGLAVGEEAIRVFACCQEILETSRHNPKNQPQTAIMVPGPSTPQ